MTNREREILEIIKKQPDIEQSEIASRLNIARASVAVHISNLQKKGYISGRIYLVNDFDYAVGIGAANVDICGRSKNPIIMADSNPGAMSISLGGVTRNICENLARLGGSVKLISALGSDLYGRMIREESTAAGIDMSQCMTVDGHPSSTYMSLLDEHGEMYVALSDMSVLQRMDMDFIKRRESMIKGARLLVFDPALPEAVVEGITSQYGDALPLFCDPVSSAYARRLKPYVGKVHTLKPNRMELTVLTGHDTDTPEGVKAACEILLCRGVKRIFVSMGHEGCLYMDSEGNMVQRALSPIENIANASGAGDAFTAAVIYSYLKGFGINRTIDYALAAGAVAVSAATTINPEMSPELIEKKLLREDKVHDHQRLP